MYSYEEFKKSAEFWSHDEHTSSDDLIYYNDKDNNNTGIPAGELWQSLKDDKLGKSIYSKYITLENLGFKKDETSTETLMEENIKLRKQLEEYKKIFEE